MTQLKEHDGLKIVVMVAISHQQICSSSQAIKSGLWDQYETKTQQRMGGREEVIEG